MFHIFVEMPTGAQSIGYEYEQDLRASNAFECIKKQLIAMKLTCSLIVEEGGIQLQQEEINAA